MTRYRSRFPFYPDDSDYKTNAPSYYEDLARKEKLIKLLAEKIWDYEEILADSLEEIEEVLKQVLNKIGEGFNQEIEDLLREWVDDGTLDHIINETLMNQKADKTEVEELGNQLTKKIEEFEKETNNKITSITSNISDLDETKTDKTTTAEIDSKLSSLKNSFDERTSPNHYYLTDPNKLQEGLNKAEGGVLFLKKQVYPVKDILRIKSNTTIIGNGATIKRESNQINSMITNDSDASIGGFNANENIEIYDLVFDGVKSTKSSIISFGHCKNIIVKNCEFKNLERMHFIEVNSSKNVLIENNNFHDYGINASGSEMLQIDLALSSAQFPWFGPYDGTPCEDLTIKNNVFNNTDRAIGTHSSGAKEFHKRITIKENNFINVRKEAIRGMDWAYVKIINNHFDDVYRGVQLDVRETRLNNVIIEDNYMFGKLNDENSRGIFIYGKDDSTLEINGGSIRGNRVKNFGSHGIGINYSRRWTISDNDVTSCGKSGILIYGGYEYIITGNNSLRNNVLEETDSDITVTRVPSQVVVTNNNTNTIRLTSGTRVSVFNNNINSELIKDDPDHITINNVIKGSLEVE